MCAHKRDALGRVSSQCDPLSLAFQLIRILDMHTSTWYVFRMTKRSEPTVGYVVFSTAVQFAFNCTTKLGQNSLYFVTTIVTISSATDHHAKLANESLLRNELFIYWAVV